VRRGSELYTTPHVQRVSRRSLRFLLAAIVATAATLVGASISLRAAAAAAPHAPQAPATSPAPADTSISPGNGTIYLGGYPNSVYVVDEASGKVTDTIALRTGIPRTLSFSHDKSRMYVLATTYESLEIIDRASKRSLDVFTFGEGTTRNRVMSFAVAPSEQYVLLTMKTATKQIDRFVIEPPKLVQYDLKQRKIVRTIPWPNDEPRERTTMIFSPDGKFLYLFGDEVVVYETANFTQVETWEIGRAPEDGFGRLDIGALDTRSDDPGFFTGLFTMQDPVQKRQMMGIGRIDLVKKQLDFFTLGPATGLRSFALAPGRQRAYALRQDIGDYEFWAFDLAGRKIEPPHKFAGRPRMDVAVSSNGKVLYIFTAGNTIDLYDAATYRYLRTIALDGDMNTPIYVVPREAGRQVGG
jgi:hypothetical protein